MRATSACTACIALSVLLLYVALGAAPDDGTAPTTNHLPTSSTARGHRIDPQTEPHRSMDSDGSDDSFSPLRGVRASSPLRGARAPSPLARQWILGAVPIGHP